MRQTLASCASMTTDWAVPWRAHCLVTYALELEDDFRLYHQLRTFPPLPTIPDIGFRAWSTYVTQVEDLILYESTQNQSARGLADWVSVTEQYLLQQHPWAPQGRASNLTTQHQPLVPAKQAACGKKAKQHTGNKSRPGSNPKPTSQSTRSHQRAQSSTPTGTAPLAWRSDLGTIPGHPSALAAISR